MPEELWPLRHEALNSIDGLTLLYNLAAQACARQLPGDIVECGVYNGGSAAAIGLAIRHHPKRLWLYDSFQGLPTPTASDDRDAARFAGELIGDPSRVRARLAEAGVRTDATILCEGWFDETFAQPGPDAVALLHIDADFYDGVRAVLRHFYDRVVAGGVIIMDDFAWWEGTRRAFYEFCVERKIAPIVHRHGVTGALYWFKDETYVRSHATRPLLRRPSVGSHPEA
ncbi:TylF/MycF/NovP-related O-methyltransferase [Micromonospora sp. WMMD1120]|uniref:TylF/MycF/NovP-related O-methyltransferase n=1 Tax=Micromonospora sp. WMMD1120 TaxID=3016106 RepID=UPI002415BF2B|nr:TylF/MycF/NovP-related O-methyltransferase [Micromonospora sp. WMMD1120]MDG4807191.1 TylF/MycF/NovP-related O-methyltransferase [Micromonospora sp. WMMD1120]